MSCVCRWGSSSHLKVAYLPNFYGLDAPVQFAQNEMFVAGWLVGVFAGEVDGLVHLQARVQRS